MRRVIALAALFAATGGLLLAAERATFILTDGERKSGGIAFHGDQHENLINGYLNLTQDNGKDLTFAVDQVAVIDFVGGTPNQDELGRLPGGGTHVLALRNGTTQQGRLINMINGDTLLWDNEAGQRQQFALRDVSRVYLNPDSSRRVFNYTPRSAAPAAAAAALPGTTIRVEARQAWTDSGLTVNQGDQVSFQASGQIAYGQSPGQTAPPEGASERKSVYPDPNAPVGTLIGKIGQSAPFTIGSQTQPIAMPASGRLLLGVNDNEVGDNTGFFLVVVRR